MEIASRAEGRVQVELVQLQDPAVVVVQRVQRPEADVLEPEVAGVLKCHD